MSAGESKGWAKGRTAATDERVARNAASHRGKTYKRHLRPEDDRRHHSADGCVARTLPLLWSDTMAYVVGLLATDGCLISDGRHLAFDSGDEDLVKTFLECLGRPVTYRAKATESGGIDYQAQFGDIAFYRWLSSVGLTPRKSLVLGPIDVQDEFLHPLARGLLDGDGSLLDYWYDGTGKAKGKRYEGFVTVFNPRVVRTSSGCGPGSLGRFPSRAPSALSRRPSAGRSCGGSPMRSASPRSSCRISIHR